MQTKPFIFLIASIATFSTASWFGAGWAVRTFELDTETKVNASLNAAGQDWASIETDGLIVGLKGAAPSETARFRALEVAARIVDTNRIDDQTTIQSNAITQIPDFSVEILRNGEELSLIGLVPGKQSRLKILQRMEPLRNEAQFTDLLESLEFDAPEGWPEALEHAITISQTITKSRIVVRPGGVSVEAFFTSGRESKETRKALQDNKPDNVDLVLNFSAPKAVVAPFRFVASMVNGSLDVKECWSDTEAAKGTIYSALSDLEADADCPEALGAPSPDWSKAITAGLGALAPLQNGDLTITDADVTLSGSQKTDLDTFEAAAKTLGETLPEFFSLKINSPGRTLPPEPRVKDIPTFRATLDAAGTLTMSGPVRDTTSREATLGFANAQFPTDTVSADLNLSGNVPSGWSPRVLAALDALSLLHDGSVEVTMERMTVTGRSAEENAPRFITDALKGKISLERMTLDIAHDPALAVITTQSETDARECERQLAGILQEAQIVFDPNSSTISEESTILVDEIAFIISTCPNAAFEIGGHTDSQGREEMNLALSQSRADAVMDALLARDVLLDQLRAQGFGETEPIADNETDDGRARNRRIAFKLITAPEDKDE